MKTVSCIFCPYTFHYLLTNSFFDDEAIDNLMSLNQWYDNDSTSAMSFINNIMTTIKQTPQLWLNKFNSKSSWIHSTRSCIDSKSLLTTTCIDSLMTRSSVWRVWVKWQKNMKESWKSHNTNVVMNQWNL